MDIDFIIIGPARSGSSLLCKLLDKHPNIRCELEHFYKSIYEDHAKKFKTDDSVEIFKALSRVWKQTEGVTTQKINGFKFLFSNLWEKSEKIYKKLLKDKDIKKILITRNPLELYISSRICSISTVDEKNWLGTKLHGTKIVFDKKQFINKIQKDNENYTYALKTIQGNLITIDYKDICNTTCFKSIHEFLDVPYVSTQLLDWGHGSTKQNYTQMSYKVENFEEMVEYISTTPYKNYLV